MAHSAGAAVRSAELTRSLFDDSDDDDDDGPSMFAQLEPDTPTAPALAEGVVARTKCSSTSSIRAACT